MQPVHSFIWSLGADVASAGSSQHGQQLQADCISTRRPSALVLTSMPVAKIGTPVFDDAHTLQCCGF